MTWRLDPWISDRSRRLGRQDVEESQGLGGRIGLSSAVAGFHYYWTGAAESSRKMLELSRIK